jgi:hypothetical protein
MDVDTIKVSSDDSQSDIEPIRSEFVTSREPMFLTEWQRAKDCGSIRQSQAMNSDQVYMLTCLAGFYFGGRH